MLSEDDRTALSAAVDRAILEESERLGEEYRMNGFGVSDTLASQIGKAAAEFDIQPEVAFGLVKTESSFKNSATSHVGARGLTRACNPRASKALRRTT